MPGRTMKLSEGLLMLFILAAYEAVDTNSRSRWR